MTSIQVGMIPKSTRNPYFEDCRVGAEEAAKEIGIDLVWEGPEQPSTRAQAENVRRFIRDGFPVIAISVEDAAGLAAVLREARAKGVKVLTWDSDGEPETRDFTVVAATAEAIAQALAFETGRLLGGKGPFAIITSSLTAPNQTAWLEEFRKTLARDYVNTQIVAVEPCNDVEAEARIQAERILRAFPKVRAFVGLCAPAVPGAAAAVSGREGARIFVTGVSLPSLCRPLIEAKSVDSVVAWSARKLGYLTAVSAHALATGVLKPGAAMLKAGQLGNVFVRKDEIRLGRVHIVNARNLPEFTA